LNIDAVDRLKTRAFRLRQHRGTIERLAEELFKRRSLSAEEIDELIAKPHSKQKG
jgi:hypothetical protein